MSCNRCGDSAATWLVTMRHPGNPAGRLLAYCDDCRENRDGPVHVAIPYSIVRAVPDLVLGALYEQHLTESDPDVAAEVVGVAPGAWTEVARRVLTEQKRR